MSASDSDQSDCATLFPESTVQSLNKKHWDEKLLKVGLGLQYYLIDNNVLHLYKTYMVTHICITLHFTIILIRFALTEIIIMLLLWMY